MTPLPKLAAPARRALASANIWNLEQLVEHTEAEIMALHGMGPNAMTALKTALMAARLRFKR